MPSEFRRIDNDFDDKFNKVFASDQIGQRML